METLRLLHTFISEVRQDPVELRAGPGWAGPGPVPPAPTFVLQLQ